ncbi:hypothetical protein ACHAO4_004602 [Trichoderma viride]
MRHWITTMSKRAPPPPLDIPPLDPWKNHVPNEFANAITLPSLPHKARKKSTPGAAVEWNEQISPTAAKKPDPEAISDDESTSPAQASTMEIPDFMDEYGSPVDTAVSPIDEQSPGIEDTDKSPRYSDFGAEAVISEHRSAADELSGDMFFSDSDSGSERNACFRRNNAEAEAMYTNKSMASDSVGDLVGDSACDIANHRAESTFESKKSQYQNREPSISREDYQEYIKIKEEIVQERLHMEKQMVQHMLMKEQVDQERIQMEDKMAQQRKQIDQERVQLQEQAAQKCKRMEEQVHQKRMEMEKQTAQRCKEMKEQAAQRCTQMEEQADQERRKVDQERKQMKEKIDQDRKVMEVQVDQERIHMEKQIDQERIRSEAQTAQKCNQMEEQAVQRCTKIEEQMAQKRKQIDEQIEQDRNQVDQDRQRAIQECQQLEEQIDQDRKQMKEQIDQERNRVDQERKQIALERIQMEQAAQDCKQMKEQIDEDRKQVDQQRKEMEKQTAQKAKQMEELDQQRKQIAQEREQMGQQRKQMEEETAQKIKQMEEHFAQGRKEKEEQVDQERRQMEAQTASLQQTIAKLETQNIPFTDKTAACVDAGMDTEMPNGQEADMNSCIPQPSSSQLGLSSATSHPAQTPITEIRGACLDFYHEYRSASPMEIPYLLIKLIRCIFPRIATPLCCFINLFLLVQTHTEKEIWISANSRTRKHLLEHPVVELPLWELLVVIGTLTVTS